MDESSDVGADLGLYVTAAGGLLGVWHAAGGREVDGFADVALTALAGVLGAFGGLLLGLLVGVALLVVHTVAVAPAVGWWRHRRFGRATLVVLAWTTVMTALLWWWPDRFLPACLIAGFGGWSVFLARRRFGEWANLGGVAVATLMGEQLVFGNLLSATYVAPMLLLIMAWLSWCGWRAMRTSRRVTVRAAADIVWSVQLGLLLSLALVWLAGVLSLSPTQVTATRAVLERAQSLTAVHWAYWLTAYTAIAVSSFLVLRWPQRFGEVRLPVLGVLDTGKRTLAGINIGLMVALVFTITAVPVSEGAWKRQVEERYALETRHVQRSEGEEAAYEQIHQYVTANRRVAAQLKPIVVAVHEAAPTEPGQPVSDSGLAIARQLGRFQAATLHLGDRRPAPVAVLSGDPDVSEAFAALDEAQHARSQQETRSGRFADAAAAAVASTLDIPDIGRNEVLHIVKAYLGGLVEEGRVRDLFQSWAAGESVRPAISRLVSIDVPALYDAAYDLARRAAVRAGVDVMAFNATYGLGLTMPGESRQLSEVVILARQTHHLTDGGSPCPGCVHPPEGGGTQTGGGTSGGGGRRG
ncbi:hypothetical protein SAMN05428985_102294 [Nocardioides sp. YR527]|uniref:hypothetical protein n=1 Tax=Nocardioides sp. YR527 TaxID=1881028 RepID=UPI0008821B55|nr:hypothetical protein [Nocardioides sp. YR527]SDK01945.1 hypothetical protein SAMN05428985_102294 [Nocardioides sp. YR527]